MYEGDHFVDMERFYLDAEVKQYYVSMAYFKEFKYQRMFGTSYMKI